jgi:hypothetical protein
MTFRRMRGSRSSLQPIRELQNGFRGKAGEIPAHLSGMNGHSVSSLHRNAAPSSSQREISSSLFPQLSSVRSQARDAPTPCPPSCFLSRASLSLRVCWTVLSWQCPRPPHRLPLHRREVENDLPRHWTTTPRRLKHGCRKFASSISIPIAGRTRKLSSNPSCPQRTHRIHRPRDLPVLKDTSQRKSRYPRFLTKQ